MTHFNCRFHSPRSAISSCLLLLLILADIVMPTPAAWSSPEMLAGVIRESRRVVAAHSRHFLALSVLFLLPLSTLLVACPALLLLSPSHRPHSTPHSLLRSSPLSTASLAAPLSIAAAVLALVACAATTFTHSVNQGFFGRPVHLLPALRSLPASLCRLLLTLLPLAALLVLLSSLLFVSLPRSSLPIAFSILAAISFIYIQLNFSLAAVIAVIESTWGFAPLRRSTHLIRGMRCASVCLNLFFVSAIAIMLWGFSFGRVGLAWGWGEVIPVIVRSVFGSAVIAVLILYCLVTNVVMYLYCKALHGELAGEIAEEFAWEYLCLPFDEQKVPHVVSVVRQ